jgi:hypothetical protein
MFRKIQKCDGIVEAQEDVCMPTLGTIEQLQEGKAGYFSIVNEGIETFGS